MMSFFKEPLNQRDQIHRNS